jgi:hypothetical protein
MEIIASIKEEVDDVTANHDARMDQIEKKIKDSAD